MLLFALIFFGVCISLPILTVGLLIALFMVKLGEKLNLNPVHQYGINLAVGLDQLANILLLGDCDETISSRTGRAIASGKAKKWVPYFGKLVDWLAWTMFKDMDHCHSSIEPDLKIKYEIWKWHD